MDDPHAGLARTLFDRAIDGPGTTSPELRKAALAGSGVPDELRDLIDKVHRHAYKVTDADLDTLRDRYSEDQLFEIIVSAALGAASARLELGLSLLAQL
jgi:alkylhydroperoxidase family enzyme